MLNPGSTIFRVRRQRGQAAFEEQASAFVVGAHREGNVLARYAHIADLHPVFAQVHGLRDLPQLLVEQRADLAQCRVVRAKRHRGDAEDQRPHQPQHEVAADRLHCRHATR